MPIITNRGVLPTKRKPAAVALRVFRNRTGLFPASDRYFWLSAACAAARRVMGTRKGEQLT